MPNPAIRLVLACAVLALLAAACGDDEGGTIDAVTAIDAPPGAADAAPGTPDAAPGTPDAAPGAPDAAAGTPDAAPGAPDAACDPQQTPGAGGHRAGEACQGCHRAGGSAASRQWTVAGTIYTDAAGGTPLGGATIHVSDAAGQQLTLVSGSSGNFWTSQAVTYPLTVRASLCPSTTAMSATVAAPGNCNSCHTSGNRIHP